jgi:uncharacterized protein
MSVRPLSTRVGAPRSFSSRVAATGSLALVAATFAVACQDSGTSPNGGPLTSESQAPGVHRQYGVPVKLGNGRARTYVVLDQKAGGRPIEVGVALDEAALQGLPAPSTMPMPMPSDGHEHPDMHPYDIPMPAQNPTPYKFLELDWNPQGHEVKGVYDVPHFDFHFYTITPAERNAIDPADPQFQARADKLPGEEFRAPFYSTLTPPGAPTGAVPRMGVHWIDIRTPELQGMLGHPENAKPFTTTFIHGSWDGQFIFDEPMITRAFIMGRKTAATAAQRDSLIPLPLPTRTAAGLTPGAYHISYDADAKEYRIALTQFVKK